MGIAYKYVKKKVLRINYNLYEAVPNEQQIFKGIMNDSLNNTFILISHPIMGMKCEEDPVTMGIAFD